MRLGRKRFLARRLAGALPSGTMPGGESVVEAQTRIGIGAAGAIAIIALLEPHMPALLAIPIYGSLIALSLWGFWPLFQRTFKIAGFGIPRSYETPIARAVAHVRGAINDLNHEKCFPETLKAIRQAALDGKIKIRGRREIDTGPSTTFSDVRSDIPSDYWKVSTIGAMATDEKYSTDTHTNPETAYAWGPKGIYEKNRYTDLAVNMQEIKSVWPGEAV